MNRFAIQDNGFYWWTYAGMNAARLVYVRNHKFWVVFKMPKTKYERRYLS